MQVHVENVSPCRKKLHIEIPADAVSREFGAVLGEFSKEVRIEGFRPGKAPPRLVKSKFSRQIREEVRDRLLPRGYQHALKQEGLRPVAILKVEEKDLSEGREFAYEVLCDVPPVFALPAYKGLSVKAQVVEVAEKDVDAVLEYLRSQRATYTDVDRAVQDGDIVRTNFTGHCDGNPALDKELAALGIATGQDQWILVEKDAFLPGFHETLVGKRVGDRVQAKASFPESFRSEALRGVATTYDIEIIAVREKQLPAVDADFLSSFGKETEADLRASLREDLKGQASQREQQRVRGEIMRQLLEATALELPESEVQDETRNAVYRMVRDITSRGASEADVQDNKERIFENAAMTAAARVKSRYILERIAQEEKIEVADKDLALYVQEMARRQGVKTDAMWAYLREKNMVENIREDLRSEKTLDFLVEQTQIVT